MIVLLTGPDCTGKTTLAQQLCKKPQTIYYHNTWYKGIDLRVDFERCYELAKSCKEKDVNLVIDRWFVDDLIYADEYREGTFFTQEEIDRYASLVDRYILCLTSKEIILQKHKEMKEQRYEEYSDISGVIDRYLLLKENRFYQSNNTKITLEHFEVFDYSKEVLEVW